MFLAVSRRIEKCLCPAMGYIFSPLDRWIILKSFFWKNRLAVLWGTRANVTHVIQSDPILFFFVFFFPAFFWQNIITRRRFFSHNFWDEFQDIPPQKNISIGRDAFYVIESAEYVCNGFIKARYTTKCFSLKSGISRGQSLTRDAAIFCLL